MTLQAHLRAFVGTLDLDVELEAADDEVVAILGPNGAGKSTILNLLAGLRALDDGRIELDGRGLDDPELGEFVTPEQRPVGVVFQDYLLFPFLSAGDNVAFGLQSRGMRKREARRAAGVWLERVGLAEHADAKPAALSGGQAQRVALARALAGAPRLLLLDEPLAALDASARDDVRRELRRHLAEFPGVRILVTHDPVDAATLATRIVVVEQGRVSQAGTFEEISAHPRSEYVADLVGLNLLRGIARDGIVTLDGGAGEVAIADHGLSGPVFAVISPRAVAVHKQAPEGSPRNRWPGTIDSVDVLAGRVRVHIDGVVPIVAEVTTESARELALEPGAAVWSAAKATEIAVYAA